MHREKRKHPEQLSAEQRARVRAEVTRPPQSFGYPSAPWNGELLSRHLATSLGIELGARQCRRLLKVFGTAPGPRRRNPRPRSIAEPIGALGNEPLLNSGVWVRSGVASAGRKELVLRKIRRLASSGLPLYPFALTLFDLIAEAIPTGGLPRAILTDPATNLSWIFANLDQAKWVPVLAKLIGKFHPTAWPGSAHGLNLV